MTQLSPPVCSQVEEKQRASVAFTKLLAAMETLGFSAGEQKAIWHVLAGIYHLGAAGACKGSADSSASSSASSSLTQLEKLSTLRLSSCGNVLSVSPSSAQWAGDSL